MLRHVVDDVLDLTRSLVDSEVELRNTVPPRIVVSGDTGRIVQILNNLLGNAAKFTRRGYIKVRDAGEVLGRKSFACSCLMCCCPCTRSTASEAAHGGSPMHDVLCS